MATANGTVKKTALDQYSRPRSVGLRAVDLVEGDHLVGTAIIDGSKDIMLLSSEGKAVRFSETDVRAMGRVSKGVRGMRLPENHSVISMVVPEKKDYCLQFVKTAMVSAPISVNSRPKVAVVRV